MYQSLRILVRGVLLGIAATSVVGAVAATQGENQADSFMNIYSLCIKHIHKLDQLEEKLKPAPTLPPEKAKMFLDDQQGKAWPVPDKYGTFVLTVQTGKNFCAVHMRRGDVEEIKKLFIQSVGQTRDSWVIVKEVKDTKPGGQSTDDLQTIAYEWTVPDASRKLLFMLSTTSSDTAPLQALGSVSVVSNK